MQDTQDLVRWLQDSLPAPVPPLLSEEELLSWLTDHCNELLRTNFPGLVQLLYRVDVSEHRLKYLLKASGGEDAGRTMALLILERVGQIVTARKKYRMPGEDIPEEEKW
jgi:hypothetical protein